ETRLSHVGLGDDGGDQATHQLKVAVDVAFEPGTDQVQLFCDIGAQRLLPDDAVLVVGKNSRGQQYQKGDRGGQIGARPQGEKGLAEQARRKVQGSVRRLPNPSTSYQPVLNLPFGLQIKF